MKRQIIVDSCVDFNEKVYERLSGILRIPFKISIGGEEIVDNNVDTSVLLSKMKAGIGKISTSCPSPYDFYEKFKKDAVNFVVTISSKLSGSYQSAEQIVDKVNEYSSGLETLFLPNSTENLERNGRISGWKASVSKALKIIPILGANGNGEIVMKSRAIGEKQAETKLINIIASTAKDIEKSTLAITFVDIKEKAEKMRETIRNSIPFKDIKIFRAGGLSTVYADRGGLVFAY